MPNDLTLRPQPMPPAEIYKLMPLVIRDVGAIPKANQNKAQNYRFRSIDDVLNAIHPVLVQHNVAISFETTDYKTDVTTRKVGNKESQVYRATLLMRVTFWASDGSSITSTAAGEGLDYGGDKATNKAMSAAFKYACFFGLAIPFVETDDSDRTTKSVMSGPAGSASRDGQQEAISPPAVLPTEQAVEEMGLAAANPNLNGTPVDNRITARESDPCTSTQVEAIKELAKAVDWTPQVLTDHIGGRRLASLSLHEADKVIGDLKEIQLQAIPF